MRLTPAMKSAIERLQNDRNSIGVGPGGGEIHPRTYRKLKEIKIVDSFATGQFDPWGPFVFAYLLACACCGKKAGAQLQMSLVTRGGDALCPACVAAGWTLGAQGSLVRADAPACATCGGKGRVANPAKATDHFAFDRVDCSECRGSGRKQDPETK